MTVPIDSPPGESPSPNCDVVQSRPTVSVGWLIAASVVALGLILSTDGGVEPVAGQGESASTPRSIVELSRFVLQALLTIWVVTRLLGGLFARLGQAPVIGEVIGGILLGPSLLGESLSARILPPDAAPMLGLLAQGGVILYMFQVGLELNGEWLRQRVRAATLIAQGSIGLPFLLGAVVSLFLFEHHAPAGVSPVNFALFLGVALSITAFPVLARILSDLGWSSSELGVLALGSAAVSDVLAWCLLAGVIGITRADWSQGLIVAAGSLVYLAVMIRFVRPWLELLAQSSDSERPRTGALLWLYLALVLSAGATAWLGIHALFGAFLCGTLIPHNSPLARHPQQTLGPIVGGWLLPAFFAFVGMRTRIDFLTGVEALLACAGVTLAATVGKLGGTWLAARWVGLSSRTALTLGILMNTRGLMELIVLNVGLELGLISPTLFAMLVVMALATTLMTSPALRWFLRNDLSTIAEPSSRQLA